MTTPNVQLGDKVEDTVTGFKGIAIARTEWLNGCWRIVVQPHGIDKDGKCYNAETFDEPQLKIIKPKAKPAGSKKTGGPRPNAVKQPATQR